MLAVQAITGALSQRERTGQGACLSTSLLDGLAAATMRLSFQRQGDQVVAAERDPGLSLLLRGIALTFMTAECADGRYIQMCARTDAHFRNWIAATGLSRVLHGPRYARVPLFFENEEDLQELSDRLRAAMRTKSQGEWMELFIHKYDVGADPILTATEFMQHPQMLANNLISVISDPRLGTIRQVGAIAAFTSTPARIERPAPALGEHQHLIADSALGGAQRTQSKPSRPWSADVLPFEGVTIVELAFFLAAPLASTLLAEGGARVIKIEPLAGDPFRKVGLEFAHLAHGKESVAIDLKTSAGREVLHRLVARADVLLHSFRPGAAERLGASWAILKEINPRLVYVYGGSYGSKGPQSHRPAFHSTPHALSGGALLQAGRGNPPIDDSYPDPCAALAVAAAIAMGLFARDRRGVGQYVETSMLCSAGYVHSDELTEFEGRPSHQSVDPEQCGISALNRLYKCAEGWLFVSATEPAQWRTLASQLNAGWTTEKRFATEDSRNRHDAELAELIGTALRCRNAADWQTSLTGACVPCSVADAATFEQFLAANGYVKPASHPAFGDYFRFRPRVRYGGPDKPRPPCALGEHTARVLQELGYSAEDVASLVQSGNAAIGDA